MTDRGIDELLAIPGNHKIAEAALLAGAFHRLAGAGLEHERGGSGHIIDAIVPTIAFAIELYLKVLGSVQQRVWHRGHDLKDLFDKLPADTRRQLSARYKARFGRVPSELLQRVDATSATNLEAVLTRSRKAFQELRYAFESAEAQDRTLPDGFGFLWAAEILSEYANEHPLPRS